MRPISNPTYLQIVESLIAKMQDEQYKYGDKLPTEYSLMKIFSVSRTTIRKALQILESKMIIKKTQGSGTFYIGTSQSSSASQKVKTKKIGLVNYYYMDYIYTEILRGIEDVIAEKGYSLIISSSNLSEARQFDSLKRLIEQDIDGLIIEPKKNLYRHEDLPLLNLIKSVTFPVVSTHWGIEAKNISTVTIDDNYAGRIAAQYLLSCGHREIGFIYKSDVQAANDRLIGLQQELEGAGCPLKEEYCFSFTSSDEEENGLQGYIQTMKLLEQCSTLPTAIFYFNDNLAIQGYRAFAERNLSIPEDISVLGFDNHNNCSIVSPPLTTFEHPKYDLGRWAAIILLEEIEKRATALPMKLFFEPRLVERHSVKHI